MPIQVTHAEKEERQDRHEMMGPRHVSANANNATATPSARSVALMLDNPATVRGVGLGGAARPTAGCRVRERA
jgi:hypothetical protein